MNTKYFKPIGKSISNFFSRIAGNAILASALLTILITFSGYMFTWYHGQITQHQRSQLLRVDSQIRDFYGPLYFLVESEQRAYFEFLVKTRPGLSSFWDADNPPNELEQEKWRLWITTVSMPNYLAIENILKNHADLIVDDELPELLLLLSAHIAGYKPVIKAWSTGDYNKNVSFYNFPQNVRSHLKARLIELKKEQKILMGKLK